MQFFARMVTEGISATISVSDSMPVQESTEELKKCLKDLNE